MSFRTPSLYGRAKVAAVNQIKGTGIMRLFAKWHVWLAWLAGLPILMWTVTGLVMVLKPIEEVRGNHLRVENVQPALVLPEGGMMLPAADNRPVKSVTTAMQGGVAVTRINYEDDTVARFDAAGERILPLNGDQARALVAQQIVGGEQVISAELFEAADVPIDFRRPVPVWQVALAGGTYVYVGRDTGAIEAVRTRWWRLFDTMWGLHIMDLESREDTSHPVLIVFTGLAVLVSLLGMILIFRRRRARAPAAKSLQESARNG